MIAEPGGLPFFLPVRCDNFWPVAAISEREVLKILIPYKWSWLGGGERPKIALLVWALNIITRH